MTKRPIIPIVAQPTKIQTRQAKGTFARWRILVVLLTMSVFYFTPWLQYNGQQAVWFDLPSRHFHIFALDLTPKDLIYLAVLMMLGAFSLFAWTTVAGRLWCGYSCPQTVYTEIMIWIDHWFEGDRNARLKLDARPWHAKKIRIKATKHAVFAVIALVTGLTFVGYFTPIRELVAALPTANFGAWELFWIGCYGGFTYLFGVVMREKVCLHMCPYARFQSVMFDADTLIISYDTARGEPRRKPKQRAELASLAANLESALAPSAGDCIDCNLCVEVCPTGIDIRNGLQYECIGCAACIDACDTVMSRINKPKGLIRYTTENTLNGRYPERALSELLKRPKVILYGVIIAAITLTAVISFINRQTFSAEVARDRGALSQLNSAGQLENSYTLHLENQTDTKETYTLSLSGSDALKLEDPQLTLTLAGGEKVSYDIQVQATSTATLNRSTPIQFTLQNQQGESLVIEANFIDDSDE